MSLNVMGLCFVEEQDILNTREKLRKSRTATECCRCGKSWGEVKALPYLQLSVIRYDDRNAVTERVSSTVL